MILRGIDFGPICAASGVQGFFGEGYWYHRILKPFGLDFGGCTFVAKTATLKPRKGNMPLRLDYTPAELKPSCIKVYPWEASVINAVGLSNPGFEALFNTRKWQRRTRPFFLSFMAVSATIEERLEETREFVKLFQKYLKDFSAPVGLQVNESCPNAKIQHDSLVEEARQRLDILSELNIPLMPKLNLLVSVRDAVRIMNHPACDALCITNTLPWKQIPWPYTETVNWTKFSQNGSPLEQIDKNGGGLSGRPLLEFVADWLNLARLEGFRKPIHAGGGILYPKDVDYLKRQGANSVFIGSVAILRGWRVQSIIRRAYKVFRYKEALR